MREAATEERFEDAARYRNRLRAIERLRERQAVERRSIGTIDVVGVAVSDERAAVQVFPLREGRMVDRYSFHLENAAGEDLDEVLEQFCLEYYGSAPSIPPQILVPNGGRRHVARWRSSCPSAAARASRCACRSGARSGGCRSSRSRTRELALESETFVAETKRARRVEALEELREALNLESLPIRIECFDISNIQGAGDRRLDGRVRGRRRRRRAHYRKFAIRERRRRRTTSPRWHEVISRRFARLGADPASDEWNESFAATPNLVVIDGGKGQLSAALAAMQRARPAARRRDRAREADRGGLRARPRRADPARAHSPGLQLLQRIRDEAHRFAITLPPPAPRRLGAESMFDQLEGVGPARRRALLQHFGSAERVVGASQAELEGVPGVPAKTARRIYEQLHRTGRV